MHFFVMERFPLGWGRERLAPIRPGSRHAWVPTFTSAEAGSGGRYWVSWSKVPAGCERRAAAELLKGTRTNIGWWHEVPEDTFLRCSFELLWSPLGKPLLKLRPRLPK